LGRFPGPGKDGQNNAKTPLLVTFPAEKNFFRFCLQELLNP